MQLPLFPLNSVLFPGMPLRLRIFEERYKEMINECIEQKTPFGVVLIEEGHEAMGSLAKPYMVGTTAHISDVQHLPLEHMNIIAVGRERFKIQELDRHSRSFLMGNVELMPMRDINTYAFQIDAAKLRPLIARYLTALSKAGQIQFDSSQIPHEPMDLAYLGAILLQEDNEQKQALLEQESAKILMSDLLQNYRREVAFLNILLSPPTHDEEHDLPFSLN